MAQAAAIVAVALVLVALGPSTAAGVGGTNDHGASLGNSASVQPPGGEASSVVNLVYTPVPPDNPLKGFVPYLGADTTYPHSLEWGV